LTDKQNLNDSRQSTFSISFLSYMCHFGEVKQGHVIKATARGQHFGGLESRDETAW